MEKVRAIVKTEIIPVALEMLQLCWQIPLDNRDGEFQSESLISVWFLEEWTHIEKDV